MSEQSTGGAATPLVHEIKSAAGERVHRYRSLRILTYATIALVGLNAIALASQLVALGGRLSLLAEVVRGVSGSTLSEAAQSSDRFVAAAAVWSLITLVPAYIVGAVWLYNAACNIRALGARGMQISPGWTVGWFAVPLASLFMPFQGVEEIYLASGSPAGWKKLKTPVLLRFWWGAWLIAGFGGYILGIIARALTTPSDLIIGTQLLMADASVSLTCIALFMVIVWRVFSAQTHSRMTVQATAQVFA